MSNGFRTHAVGTKKELEQKTRGALARIEGLEQSQQRLLGGVNNVFNQVGQRLGMLEEMMAACVDVLGVEQIQAALTAAKVRRAEAQSEDLKGFLKQSLEKGEVVPATVIAKDSLIVGVEKDAKGVVLVPGRVQTAISEVIPELQEKLMGKAAGDIIATTPKAQDGSLLPPGTFEVQEVYQILPSKEEVPVELMSQSPAEEVPSQEVQ